MATNMRPEVSEKNPYWIPKERYYELKHFCRQYPVWKKAYNALDGFSKHPEDIEALVRQKHIKASDPTSHIAESKIRFSRKIDMVERCANEADSILYPYIIKYVTKGYSYNALKLNDNIPCGKDIFYDTVRKFYWLLSKERD